MCKRHACGVQHLCKPARGVALKFCKYFASQSASLSMLPVRARLLVAAMALAARPSALACRLSAPLLARGATRAARRARRAPSRAQGATQGAAHEPGASSLAALSSRTRELVSNVLPYWTLIVASSALVHPPLMAWIGKEYWSTALR